MNAFDREIETSTEALKARLLKSQLGHPTPATKIFEPLLSSVDAASLLSLHPVTILRWAREGKIPHLRLGKKVMFRASELNAWCVSGYSTTAVRVA
jgi:excisionase family DNA binding protein